MLQNLIVPLDGSEEAERALPFAVQLAAARGGSLTLIRAVPSSLVGGFDWEPQYLTAMNKAETYLSRVADSLVSRVPVLTAAIDGSPASSVLQAAAELPADAIVMATHGRTGLDHLLHGSVAEAVLAQTTLPVLLVYLRSGGPTAPPFDPTSARVLVPLDRSAYSEAALRAALQLVGTVGELVLVTVASPPQYVERDEYGRPRAYLDQQEERLKREASEYLRVVKARLARTCPGHRALMDVRVGDAAAGIVMAEVDRRVDVVVMSTRGRTGLGRAIMGSVAGEVLRSGRAPVLLVGPAAAADPNVQPSQLGVVGA